MTFTRWTSLTLATGLILGGCNSGFTGDDISDLIRDGITDGGGDGVATEWPATEDGPDLAIPSTNIRSFGRTYDELSVERQISQSGDNADAEIQRIASGELTVLMLDGSEFIKEINNDSGRRFVTVTESAGGEWIIDEISVYAGQSEDGRTEITQVAVQWGDNEIIFADPSELHPKDVLSFAPGQEVTVTVRVNETNAIGVIHQLDADVQPLTQKLLESVTSTELRNTYHAPATSGQYFTHVDIFERAGVVEKEAEYSAAAWGMPYYVVD